MTQSRVELEKSSPAGRPNRGDPAFLIVGTGRSGTTLVQRLACELPGVRIPPETKFFSHFVPEILRREHFPLAGGDLDRILAVFKKRGFEYLGFDPAHVAEQLGGRCNTVFELFGAVIRELAGEASFYGEKTPRHLLWWRPLSRAMPHLKFIAVVRDPRAVVASNLAVSWGKSSHVVLAERWSLDQKQILSAQKHLPATRLLVVRYEDVVTDTSTTRSRLSRFLDVPESNGNDGSQQVAKDQIIRPRETSWKDNVLGPVTTDRQEAWRESLSEQQAREIVSICRAEMVSMGYTNALPSRFQAALQLARLRRDDHAKRLRYKASHHKVSLRTRRISSGSGFQA